jgi:hypothetical protein
MTHISCAMTLKTKIFDVLITLDAICDHLKASSVEVNFNTIRYTKNSLSDPASS